MGLIRQYNRIESKRGDGVESEAAGVLESFVSLVAGLSLFGASVDLNLLLPASVVESAAIKYECSADYLYLCTGLTKMVPVTFRLHSTVAGLVVAQELSCEVSGASSRACIDRDRNHQKGGNGHWIYGGTL